MNRRDHIRAAFSAAADGYEQAATAQDWAAEQILSFLPPPAAAFRGLEIGCGTGLLTRRLLAYCPADWTITDLSPHMLDKARCCGPATYACLDGERDPLPHPPYDLIVSNLAFQWFDDLPTAIQHLRAALRPGGQLIFSTMGQNSFAEWRTAHQQLGLQSGLMTYPDAETLRQAVPGAEIDEAVFPLHFDYAGHFARSLKQLGATVPQPGHVPLGPGQMRRLIQAAPRPFQTSYHLLFVRLGA